jgi:hypothetical protein
VPRKGSSFAERVRSYFQIAAPGRRSEDARERQERMLSFLDDSVVLGVHRRHCPEDVERSLPARP